MRRLSLLWDSVRKKGKEKISPPDASAKTERDDKS
jgi:hypothetical protein